MPRSRKLVPILLPVAVWFTLVTGCDFGDADVGPDAGINSSQQELTEHLLWRGHTISRWDTVQEQYASDIKMTDAPGGRSGQAIRFRVTPTSKPIDQGKPRERAELARATLETPGTAALYTFKVFFPSDFKPAAHTKHNTFAQWHHVPFPGESSASGQANAAFFIDSRPGLGEERIMFKVYAGNVDNPTVKTWDLGPLRRNRWYDMSLRVLWHANPDKGFIRVGVNGKPKIKWHKRSTLYNGNPGVKMKIGFYRAHASWNSVLYHDEMRRYALK